MEEENVSLLIVDRNLPNIEGSDFVKSLRDKGYNIPVIFLTAKDKDDDIDEGFQKGADDYMTKPFRIKELLFRVKAILKRAGIQKQNKIKYKDLLLDTDNRILIIDNKTIELTNLEYNLMYLFIKNANQPLNRETLRECWGVDSENAHEKTINVAINSTSRR